jgi:hypothetical protein
MGFSGRHLYRINAYKNFRAWRRKAIALMQTALIQTLESLEDGPKEMLINGSKRIYRKINTVGEARLEDISSAKLSPSNADV